MPSVVVLDPEFVDRVKNYIASTEGKGEQEIRIVSMWELASGVVAIHDSWNEYDMYFDLEKWKIKYRDLWGDLVFPPALAGLGIGVLSGIGVVPNVSSVSGAKTMASRHLASKTDDQEWRIIELVVE